MSFAAEPSHVNVRQSKNKLNTLKIVSCVLIQRNSMKTIIRCFLLVSFSFILNGGKLEDVEWDI